MERTSTLFGKRVMLRPLVLSDFSAWREVRLRCADWLLKWEPQRLPHQPDTTQDRDAFAVRCSARQRERQLGSGYGFGIFVDGAFCGEINLSSIQRGPFQNAYVGYWIDEKWAGQGIMPESVIVLARFAFEELRQELVVVVTDAMGKSFKPSVLRFTDALPKTRSAKVLRRAIRATALGTDPGDLSSLEDPAAVTAVRDAR